MATAVDNRSRYINTRISVIKQELTVRATFFNEGSVLTTGTSVGMNTNGFTTGIIFLNVTAISGTATVNINAVDFLSGGKYGLVSPLTITATGFYSLPISLIYGDEMELNVGLSGTSPSITLSGTGVFRA